MIFLPALATALATFFAANFGGEVIHPEEQASLLHIPLTDAESPPVQIRLEELIAKGAVKLTGAELSALISGATVTGYNIEGGWAVVQYKPGGVTEGIVQNSFGQFVLSGTWRMNEEGRICSAGQATGGFFNYNRLYSGCGLDWYRLGSNYYAISGENGLLRLVKR